MTAVALVVVAKLKLTILKEARVNAAHIACMVPHHRGWWSAKSFVLNQQVDIGTWALMRKVANIDSGLRR
jgi:hypothetical protein